MIDELDYRPSSVARNLSLGRTHTIAVVIPFLTNASSVERLRGVIHTLRDSRYDLVLFDVERPQTRDALLSRLADRSSSDALLVISLPLSDREVERFGRARMPVVLVDCRHEGLPHLRIDDVAGGRLATRHLLDLGHERVAFVGDTPSLFGFTSSRDRRTGYEETLREAGIEPHPEYIREAPHGRDLARRMGAELLHLAEPPTAVFAASDTQALGAGLLLRLLGGTELGPAGETLGLELVIRSTTAPPD